MNLHPVLENLPRLLSRGGSHFCLHIECSGVSDTSFWSSLWKKAPAPEMVRLEIKPLILSGPFQALGDHLLFSLRNKPEPERRRIISSASPYYLHRNLLATWLSGEVPCRWDDLFRSPGEMEEERRLLNRCLGKILKILHPQGLLVLEGLENASTGLLNFLKDTGGLEEGLPVLALKSPKKEGLDERFHTAVHPWFSWLEDQDRILFSPIEVPAAPPAPPGSSFFIFSGYQRQAVCRSLHLWDDASSWPGDSLESSQAALEAASISLLKGFPEESHKILSPLKKNTTPPWFTALIQARRLDWQKAEGLLEEEFKRFPLLSLRDRYGTLLTFLTFQDRQWVDPEGRKRLTAQLSDLGASGDILDPSSIVVSLNYLLGIAADSGWDKAVTVAQELAENFRSNGNKVALAKTMHILGYLYEDRSVDMAQDYYRQSLGLRREFSHPLETVKALNGSGFYSYRIGEFLPALRYFREALEALDTIRDFHEICLTIFNIGVIFLINFESEAAFKAYETVLKAMRVLKLPHLPFHSLREILAMTGISAYHQGRFSFCLDLEVQFAAAPEGTSGSPFQHLFLFLMARIKKNDQEADAQWQKAWRSAQELPESFVRGHLCLERYLWLMDSGRPAEARDALTLGYKNLGRYGPSEQKRLMEHLAMGKDMADYQPLGIQGDRLESLLARIDLQLELVKTQRELDTMRRRVAVMEAACRD